MKLKSLVATFSFALLPFLNPVSADEPKRFEAMMTGGQAVPSVETKAVGLTTIQFNDSLTSGEFSIRVMDGQNITAAQLHCGKSKENGPAILHLFGRIPGGFDVDGLLAAFTFTHNNLIKNAKCSPSITNIEELAKAVQEGKIYVNIQTVKYPKGELRGQLIAR